mgnify:CR=1 FL=1
MLTGLSAFWFARTLDIVANHVLSTDPREYPEEVRPDAAMLAGRSMLVRRTEPLPIECVARGYLIGSGWKDYQTTGAVCGIKLPAGLQMAQKLLAALGDDPKSIEGYGKGAIVGTAGESEHCALWHVPGGYGMRELLNNSKAIVPSAGKVGTAGTRIDQAQIGSCANGRFEDIEIAMVPGAMEVSLAAQKMAQSGKYNAIICLAAVIRGATPHFEQVTSSLTRGLGTRETRFARWLLARAASEVAIRIEPRTFASWDFRARMGT